MLKGLVWGIGFTVIVIVISVITGNWQLGTNICSFLGVASLILAMIFSGSLKSGEGMRAFYTQENKSDQISREARVTWLAMFALPNIAAALLIYRFV